MENRNATTLPSHWQAALPSLPSIEDFSPDIVPATTTNTIGKTAAVPPPPPPPPPPAPLQTSTSQKQNVSPPPPSHVPQPTQKIQQQPTVKYTVPPVPPENVANVAGTTPSKIPEAQPERNNLLAAIQNGFKLRKTSGKNKKKRKAKQQKPRNPMEELRQRLEKRRANMSNDKPKNQKKKRAPMYVFIT